MWPNLFIVGAAKSGTTSLYHYLAEHPDTFMPEFKEPHFFSRIEPSPERRSFVRYIADEPQYLKLFRNAPPDAVVVGEASTSYLWAPGTAERIHACAPDAKIVAMLRNPVERAYSHYLNNVREGYEERPFATALEQDWNAAAKGWGVSALYVELGFYHEQLERYERRFGEAVHIVVFEDFVADPRSVFREVLRFLGLDAGFADAVELEQHNPFQLPVNSVAHAMFATPWVRDVARYALPGPLRRAGRALLLQRREKPTLSADARAFLEDLYRDEIATMRAKLDRPTLWSSGGAR